MESLRVQFWAHFSFWYTLMIQTTLPMFADDTSLTAYGKSIEEIELGLNEDLEKIDCGYNQIS